MPRNDYKGLIILEKYSSVVNYFSHLALASTKASSLPSIGSCNNAFTGAASCQGWQVPSVPGALLQCQEYGRFFKRGVWVFKNDIKQLPYVNQDLPCLASPWLQVLVVYNKERRKKNGSSILTALSHMPFEEKHHALTVQPLFFFTRSRHEKRNYAKIQGNRRKKKIRRRQRSVNVLKDQRPRRKEKNSKRPSVHQIRLFKQVSQQWGWKLQGFCFVMFLSFQPLHS